MSYCRFSSMDFKCDLYVYEAEDCYCVHVATNRIVGDVPPLRWGADPNTFRESYKAQINFIKEAKREPIGLEYDGESFYLSSKEELLECLELLKQVGYIFPYEIIEEMREENQNELD